MANTYVNEATASQSTTEQSRILRCNVSTQLNAGDTVTVVTANSVGVCIDIIGFNHVASGAAGSFQAVTNAGSTSPGTSTMTAAAAGDLVLGCGCAGNSPSVASLLDASGGKTMTQINTTQAGQSRTSWAQYLVESGAGTWNPRATLGTSQPWAFCGARWDNDGSTITAIASSAATTGWQADPGNKTFTINIPVGVTIPAGATLFLFVNSTANTGTNTISDNASGANVAPTVTGNPSITGTARRGQTLTCVDGSATGTPSPTVSARQWKRNGTNIGAATGTTYALTAADDGATVTVAVTWTNTAGSATGTSTATTNVSEARTVVAQNARIEFCGNSMIVDRNTGVLPPVVYALVPDGSPLLILF